MQKTIKLSPFFINHIKAAVKPRFTKMGWVVFQRTYARYIDSKKRYETWPEVVERVVNGNINLDPRLKHNPSQKVIDEDTKEAENLFTLIYSLSGTPSGRNLWISGTPYMHRAGDSLNNCWFIAIRAQAYGHSHIQPFYASNRSKLVSMPFAFAFDELMKGGGVGFSSTKDNIAKIPAVKRAVNLTIVCSEKHENWDKLHKLGAISKELWLQTGNEQADLDYTVPDTREGWVLADALMIDSHFMRNGKSAITLDISNIRPEGRKIHGFGGTSAGPMPLVQMLFSINKVLNNKVGKHLTAVDTTDMMNFTGKAVVAGNVRRSAEMALGSSDDQAFIKMKQDKAKLMDRRWASNNSIMIDNNFDNYDPVADGILKNGEPGVFNLELSKNYGRIIDGYNPKADPNVEGTNPCLVYNTLLRTESGYAKIGDLAKSGYAYIINPSGNKVQTKIWCSGIKDTVKITDEKGRVYQATPNHRFMTENGLCFAKNLRGQKLISYDNKHNYKIVSVKPAGKEKVYDFTEPETHLGIISVDGKLGIIVHNCGEISLDNGEPCNLFDVNPYIAEKQKFPIKLALQLAQRYTKRVTFSHYDWQVSRDCIRHNRRTGVSLTGIQDFVIDHFGHRIVKGWTKDKKPIYHQDCIDWFDKAFKTVVASDKQYSKELHCNESIKHTTVKPSGTVAKLSGVSEGMHFHYAGYLIQRIRFQKHDPLVKVLAHCGFFEEPDVYNPNTTTCVEFPLRAPHADDKNFASAGTVSMREQLATQAFLQTYWSNNAVSCTITFNKLKEGKLIGPELHQFRHVIKSTSMLPYYGAGLTQAPKEPIAKEDEEARAANIHGDVQKEYYKEMVKKGMDYKGLSIIGQKDCAGGACPIK